MTSPSSSSSRMQSPPNLHLSSAKIQRPLANAMYMSEVYELKPLKSIVFVMSADSTAAWWEMMMRGVRDEGCERCGVRDAG